MADLVGQRIIVFAIFASAALFALPSKLVAAECVPTASPGSQQNKSALCTCRIGPVTVDVPVCEIKTNDFDDFREDYIDWTNNDGIVRHIVVKSQKRPRKFKDYVNEWWHHHKCFGQRRRVGDPSRFDDATGPGDIPPQVTWTGCCAAPVCFIARAIGVENQVVELQVELGLHYKMMVDFAPEQIFATLLAQVRLTRPAEKRSSPPRS